MTVPGRVEAARLLLSLRPVPRAVRHARAVAEVAAWLALRTADRRPIDRSLVEAAALLHDVDKLLPDGDPMRRLGHGAGSAEWLARRGHAELAAIVRDHPVTRLADPVVLEGLLDGAPEAAIVAYADKRAAQRLGPLDARFANWRRRYPGSTVDDLRSRADRLEAEVCARAGIRPPDVRRLRWTGAAFAMARRA
jgi:HD domain